MTTNPVVIAAVLAQLDDGPRDVITRVRTTEKFKGLFAQVAAAKGLPSATHAYNLMRAEVQAHVKQQLPGRTGTTRRPVVHHVNQRRLC